MKNSRKQLYADAKKYLDLKSLFPKTKNKITLRNMNDYQAKKIKKTMKTLISLAGSRAYLERDFIPMRRSKKLRNYHAGTEFPTEFKGLLIAGGEKVNKGVTIDRRGNLSYRRGVVLREVANLDAATEKRLIKSVRAHKNKIKSRPTHVGTNGNYIRTISTEPEEDAPELLEEAALFLFNKYATMAQKGQTRSNGRKAEHPKKWGLQLMWEYKS